MLFIFAFILTLWTHGDTGPSQASLKGTERDFFFFLNPPHQFITMVHGRYVLKGEPRNYI